MNITRIIGGAGTGKTTRLMDILESLIESGIDPLDIGFSSFTRVAVTTAAERAAAKFGLDQELLTERGWYRTLHASCYHILGMKPNLLLTDDKRSVKWLEECFGMEVGSVAMDAETGFSETQRDSKSELARWLAWWSYTRSTLSDPQVSYDTWLMDKHMPFAKAARMAVHYEQHKLRDGLRDFCDLQLAVAGIRVSPTGISDVPPEGLVPDLRAWIFDEYQDTSHLSHAVAERLASAPNIEHIYTSGDPFQSIYRFSGGDPHVFLGGFNYTHKQTLRQSYRCSPPVMAFAENTIRMCTDYFDRGIQPRDASEGDVYNMPLERLRCLKINSSEKSWLMIARTNAYASRLITLLNQLHIPWDTTVGGTFLGWKKRGVAKSILALRDGQPITPQQWSSIVSELPASSGGSAILRRGVKTQASEGELAGLPPAIMLADLPRCGATDTLPAILAGDDWPDLVPGLRRFDNARRTCGLERALQPRVRVGTIHSVKGDEADNVVLYDALSKRSQANIYIDAANDEERRVWYVGASRARENLYVGHFRKDKTHMF